MAGSGLRKTGQSLALQGEVLVKTWRKATACWLDGWLECEGGRGEVWDPSTEGPALGAQLDPISFLLRRQGK